MNHQSGLLEFAVTCLADVRFLLKAWQRFLVREGMESSETSPACITIEDRRPGEELMLCFPAARDVWSRFLQSIKDRGLKFTFQEPIPGMLCLCRIVRDRGVVQVIGAQNGGE
jgi:hypothetical protein